MFFRILTKIRNKTIYVRDILPHADYDKWCKNNVHQGKI